MIVFHSECLVSFAARTFPRNPRFFFWLLGVGGLNVSPSTSPNCLVLVLSFLSPAVLVTCKLWNFRSLMEMGPSSCQKKNIMASDACK